MSSFYDNYTIFDLRKIAREIGVKSPSSMKKDILIQEIINIETGENKPHFSKKGRPAKNTIPIDTKVDTMELKQILGEIQVAEKRLQTLISRIEQSKSTN